MILFPAIDLKDGVCVRLKQGQMTQATVFNRDPVAQARLFEEAGFRFLHLVDLDGAIAGRGINGAAVESILTAVKIPVQLGGGIRDEAGAAGWLEKGVSRVILGTAAVRDPVLVRRLCKDWPGRIVVGLDAREGRVALEGWVEQSDLPVEEAARRFEDSGVAAIIHTDISRDGMMQGVNVAAGGALAQAVSIPVIVSGGVAKISDIEALAAVESPGIAGVIIGRALYEGGFHIRQALALAAQTGEASC